MRVVDPDLRDRMSEWVVLQCCCIHLRQLRRYERQQTQNGSGPRTTTSRRPADVRVGVLGLGELGLDAARKLQAIGFDVAGWSATPKSTPGHRDAFTAPTGSTRCSRAPTCSSCLLPLTPATRGMLNASLFAKLARDGRLGGPILINAGRGGLQVEADIVAALDAGVLKGASLDVFEPSRCRRPRRCGRHPSVYVSPHNAAISRRPTRSPRYVAGQIAAFERGEPLRNVVDRARGY